MKKILKKILPKKIRQYGMMKLADIKNIKLINDGYAFDIKKFKMYSSAFNVSSKEKLRALILKEYHAVEKGLALRNTRVGFGVLRIKLLIVNLREYINLYGIDEVSLGAIESLKEYKEFDNKYNTKGTNQVIPEIEKIVDYFDINYKKDSGFTINDISGGTKTIKKSDIQSTLGFDFANFFKSRYSIRDFSDEPVDTKDVVDAIDIAKYVPSVCNRQPWKAYVVDHSNSELKRRLLDCQNGNKGFGDSISCLIVVTGKLSHFFAYERNQAFIDGGMFAMGIVMALHSKGYGTCCLNLSFSAEKNRKFDEAMDFDSDSVPIMFIGVGNLKDTFKVAASYRKNINEIVSVY